MIIYDRFNDKSLEFNSEDVCCLIVVSKMDVVLSSSIDGFEFG